MSSVQEPPRADPALVDENHPSTKGLREQCSMYAHTSHEEGLIHKSSLSIRDPSKKKAESQKSPMCDEAATGDAHTAARDATTWPLTRWQHSTPLKNPKNLTGLGTVSPLDAATIALSVANLALGLYAVLKDEQSETRSRLQLRMDVQQGDLGKFEYAMDVYRNLGQLLDNCLPLPLEPPVPGNNEREAWRCCKCLTTSQGGLHRQQTAKCFFCRLHSRGGTAKAELDLLPIRRRIVGPARFNLISQVLDLQPGCGNVAEEDLTDQRLNTRGVRAFHSQFAMVLTSHKKPDCGALTLSQIKEWIELLTAAMGTGSLPRIFTLADQVKHDIGSGETCN
jgi:hypothetical protein